MELFIRKRALNKSETKLPLASKNDSPDEIDSPLSFEVKNG